MRPVRRGTSPQTTSFTRYQDAKSHLLGRIDRYCSYCERRIETMLAVEHIQPKGLPAYAALAGEWNNFLLGCVNCNSTKNDKNVVLADVLLPDRDNTFLAYEYGLDGSIKIATGLSARLRIMADNLLKLTGLDRTINTVLDDNGVQIVVDRASKRIEVYGIALECAADLATDPNNKVLQKNIVKVATAEGQFSIWMKVFAGNPTMLAQLIDAHRGTRQSACFDPVTQLPLTPHPNADGLTPGGRI